MENKHCQFKCNDENCNAEETAVRGQILIGTINDEIRDEALNCWTWGIKAGRNEDREHSKECCFETQRKQVKK